MVSLATMETSAAPIAPESAAALPPPGVGTESDNPSKNCHNLSFFNIFFTRSYLI